MGRKYFYYANIMRLDMARIKCLRVRQEMEIKRYKSQIGIGTLCYAGKYRYSVFLSHMLIHVVSFRSYRSIFMSTLTLTSIIAILANTRGMHIHLPLWSAHCLNYVEPY